MARCDSGRVAIGLFLDISAVDELADEVEDDENACILKNGADGIG
jgi:hypothetical protein